jgi:hypothetical protein
MLTNLRSNESLSAWLDHLDAIGPPPSPPIVPSGNDLTAFLRYVEVPTRAFDPILRLRPEIDRDPDLRWLLDRSMQSLLLEMDRWAWPPAFPRLPEELGEITSWFFIYVYAAITPHTRALHETHGIPDHVTQATLSDIGRHVLIHQARHQTLGLAGPDWMMLHARGMLFQLGRLQFERARLGTTSSSALQQAGHPYQKGDPVLAVHIPGFMGPFTPEDCDASFALAREFFATHFPDERYQIAVCYSWLLDPQLSEYLSPSSNIIRFQQRFQPLYTRSEESNRTTLEFVFRTPDRPLDELPQNTTLERAVVQHIRDGRFWHGGMCWLPLTRNTGQ